MTLEDSAQEMPTTRQGMGRRNALKLLLAGAVGTALGAAGYAGLSSSSNTSENTPRIYDAEVSQNGPNIEFVIRDTKPIVLNDNAPDSFKSAGGSLNSFHKYVDIDIDGKPIFHDDQSFLKYALEVERVSPHEIKGVIRTNSGAPALSPGVHNLRFGYMFQHKYKSEQEDSLPPVLPNEIRRSVNFR